MICMVTVLTGCEKKPVKDGEYDFVIYESDSDNSILSDNVVVARYHIEYSNCKTVAETLIQKDGKYYYQTSSSTAVEVPASDAQAKLEEILGQDWIKADFSSDEVYSKINAEFKSLTRQDLEQIGSIASKSGINALTDMQKKALEVLYKTEYS